MHDENESSYNVSYSGRGSHILIMILINEEACPWKATWRDAMQGRLYLEGWHSTNVTLGRFLPSMSCVVKLPNNCGLSELYLKYYE